MQDQYSIMKQQYLVHDQVFRESGILVEYNYTMRTRTPFNILVTITGEDTTGCDDIAIINCTAEIFLNGTAIGNKSLYDSYTTSCPIAAGLSMNVIKGIRPFQSSTSYAMAQWIANLGMFNPGSLIVLHLQLFQGDDIKVEISIDNPAFSRDSTLSGLMIFLVLLGTFSFCGFSFAGLRRLNLLRSIGIR